MNAVRRAGRTPLAGVMESSLRRLGAGRRGSLLVAASGGADSTALLLLAAAVATRRGWRLECATVDHHLRDESASDAAFVETLCRQIGVPCRRLDVRPGRGPGAPARARRERYRALLRFARERDLACVLTAHHAHDQLETMLLAISRGAGVRAAGGMRARRRLGDGVMLLRPLLGVAGPLLRELCRKCGVAWREDPSNGAPSSPRAALRARVIPELERIHAGAAARASQLASTLRSAGRGLEREARKRASDSIDRGALRRLPRAERTELIRAMIRRGGGRPTAARAAEIDAAVRDRRRHRRSWRVSASKALELVADRLRLTDRGSVPAPSARRIGSARPRPSSPPEASRSRTARAGD